MSTMKFCGFNGYQQFPGYEEAVAEIPTCFQLEEEQKFNKNLLQFLWSFNLFAKGNVLMISGFIKDSPGQIKKIELEEEIQQISCNEKIILVLLMNDKIFKYHIADEYLCEVIFRTSSKSSIKRSIFGEPKTDDFSNKTDSITHISSNVTGFIVITKDGGVYCLPTKIYQFAKNVKVKDLCSGFEHFLILTTNGDIYSWGSGLRGQLGNNDLESYEAPQIVEALAGIKINFISAGGWQSTAISAFGDLYVWGNNVNGQLGIKVYKTTLLNTGKEIQRKNPTVYPLPEIVDIECNCTSSSNQNDEEITSNCNIEKIYCGARHSIAKMACGRIYATGLNDFYQLGLPNEEPKDEDEYKEEIFVDKFTEITSLDYNLVEDIICGHWCTVFNLKVS